MLQALRGNIISKGVGLVGGLLGKAVGLAGPWGKVASIAAPIIMSAAPDLIAGGLNLATKYGRKALGYIASKWNGADKYSQAMSNVGKLDVPVQGNIHAPQGSSLGEAYKTGMKQGYDSYLGKDTGQVDKDTGQRIYDGQGNYSQNAYRAQQVVSNPANSAFGSGNGGAYGQSS